MILSNNLIHKTHYEMIGIKEDATLEEIRKAYRSSILNYHPDKLQTTSDNPNPEHELGNRFLDVQRAWEILADPRSRALYDSELRTLRQDAVTAEDVELEDLTIEDDESCFELSYNCRCGDYFSVDSSELAEMGYLFTKKGSKISIRAPESLAASVILPCGSCSLKIRLLIDGDITLETKVNRGESSFFGTCLDPNPLYRSGVIHQCIKMNSGQEKPRWTVFQDVKNTSDISPEALMAEINSAISALEYARASTFLQSSLPAVSKSKALIKS